MRSPASDDERLGAVFASLADGTRREVVRRLASSPASASALARELPISRQAIAKHLDVLGEAGLVRSERVGREVRYRVMPEPLNDLAAWAARVGSEWEQRLDALDERFSAEGN